MNVNSEKICNTHNIPHEMSFKRIHIIKIDIISVGESWSMFDGRWKMLQPHTLTSKLGIY